MNINHIEKYNVIRKELLEADRNIFSLLTKARSIEGVSDHILKDQEKSCRALEKKISEEVFRIAVVGPLKSGKSTFVNSLLKGDYLKRGAGTVTSIITKVRGGESTQAKLQFKTWDEVNADIQQALVLFPTLKQNPEDVKFDVRQEPDRRVLQDALNAFPANEGISSGALNSNRVLLTCYLKGYERVRKILSTDNITKAYENDIYREHWDFVSQEPLSAYLKDIQLEINPAHLTSGVEIADCQGSDSLNPLYLTMIQDYLMLANLIIYVISSRTGLRMADIKFLSMIKKMGIIHHALFVVNCDISEHESFDELISIVAKVKEELSFFKPDPEVYTISALFGLFRAIRQNLAEKDSMRLIQWEKQKEFVNLSVRETSRFDSDIHQDFIGRRNFLILNNYVEHQGMILSGIKDWITVSQEILARDAGDARKLIARISQQRERMNRIKAAIKNTLEGAVPKIKHEIKIDTKQFFDSRSGNVLSGIVEFIKAYTISNKKYEKSLTDKRFSDTLYWVYQDFKQALDHTIAETFQPELIHFVKQMEKKIDNYFQSILDPYTAIVENALIESNTMKEELGSEHTLSYKMQRIELADLNSLKAITGLKLSPLVAYMRYSAKIKTEGVLRLGFYALVRVFKKTVDRQTGDKKQDQLKALQAILQRMKRETQNNLLYHCDNYRENLELNYLFRFVDVASDHLCDNLLERFQAYVTDLSLTVGQISQGAIDKQKVCKVLKDLELMADDIFSKISRIKEKIDK